MLLFRGAIRIFFWTGLGLSVEDETFRLFFGSKKKRSPWVDCVSMKLLEDRRGEGGEVGIGEDKTGKTSGKLAFTVTLSLISTVRSYFRPISSAVDNQRRVLPRLRTSKWAINASTGQFV